MYMRNNCMEYPEAKEMPKQEVPRQEMMGMGMGECCQCCQCCPGIVCPPIYECPTERVCHRQFVHEVPHVCPCNTRIINHHIYRHTFTPCYSCCEENEVSNVFEHRCCM